MRILAVTIAFFIGSFITFGQNMKVDLANDYFNKLSYAYALPLYEELTENAEHPELKSRLAICYFKLGDTERAELHFSDIIASDQASTDDYFYYAQSLKQNGKYQKSDEWMKKIHEMAVNDRRGISYSRNEDYLYSIEKMGDVFEIRNLDVNSEYADFGGYPAQTNQSFYIISARNESITAKKEWPGDGMSYLDIYKTKGTVNRELTDVKIVPRNVNKRYHEGPLCFTRDGLTVFYTRNNVDVGNKGRDKNGIKNLKIYQATLDNEGNWLNEKEVSFNSKDYSVGHPTLSPDEKTMYFASDMPGGFGATDLYKVELFEDYSFGKITNMGKNFNTEGDEMFPWVGANGDLYFASNGQIGLGGLDIFVCESTGNGFFSKMANVGLPVNSNKDDFAFIVSDDNLTGYFSSNRDGGKGGDDIYYFERKGAIHRPLELVGTVTDVETGEVIPKATVSLETVEGRILRTMVADEKGQYSFNVLTDSIYMVRAIAENYLPQSKKVDSYDIDPLQDNIVKDLELEYDPGISVYAVFRDAETREPIEGLNIIIYNSESGEEVARYTTNIRGEMYNGVRNKKVDENLTYYIDIKKDGYFNRRINLDQKIEKEGTIYANDLLKEGLDLDKAVNDLGTMGTLNLNPINFDLNKANIRPDAAAELDKMVEVLNRYPDMKIELGSHTDCRASEQYNLILSQKRAISSANYLKKRVINPSRISYKGYGEARLINDCDCSGSPQDINCDDKDHEQNRRTEFIVISTGDNNVKVNNSSPNSF